jgi:hypothetical protein
MRLLTKSGGAALILAALVAAPQDASAKSALAGCDAFIANLRKIASDLQSISLIRSLSRAPRARRTSST